MKKWSEMSHGEKADFWGEVSALFAILSLLTFVVLLVFMVYFIVTG